ncbi:MAG: twin-arginine translocase subunit TatC [Rhodospirillaceae bacterium]|nr:twin-arginine translocase subunit TatC [Rhodospirillaceae bacterium]
MSTESTAKPSGDPDEYKMPLMDHLVELRKRLLWSFVAFIVTTSVAMFFAGEIFNFLAHPLAGVFKGMPGSHQMIYTQLYEKFFTNIKIGVWTGFFLSFPIFALQIWKFVAPGLYKHERHAFLPFLIATPILFFMGGAFVYFIVFPMAWHFFAEFEQFGSATEVTIQMMPKVNEYLSLVMKLIFAFGICFETPVLLGLLARAGLASAKGLAKARRYAVVIIFVIAAIITPPDVISQLALAIPMILLYEVGIWVARGIEKKRAAADAAFEAELEAQREADRAAENKAG